MSHFATKLKAILDQKNLSLTELAGMSGLSLAHIWKLATGKQTWVSVADLTRISLALTDNPRERAELLYAHLLDECQGPGADLIQITIEGKETPELRTIAPGIEKTFRILRREAEFDTDLQEMLNALARLVAPEQKVELLIAAEKPAENYRAEDKKKSKTHWPAKKKN